MGKIIINNVMGRSYRDIQLHLFLKEFQLNPQFLLQITLGCFPTFTTWRFCLPPTFPPLPMTYLSRILLFLLYFWKLPHGIYKTGLISICLPSPLFSMRSNRNSVVLLLFILFSRWFFCSRKFGSTLSLRRVHLFSVAQI